VLFSIPVIGTLSSFLVGGLPGENSALARFYFLHVAILPLVFWCGLYMSFSGIRRVGLSEIPGEERRGGSGAYLAHLYSLLILALGIFGILVTFSVLWATPFGAPVNPYETAVGTRMPWYLLAPYGFIEVFPRWIPLWVRSSLLMIVLLVFVLFPALDYRSEISQRKRKIALTFGSAVFLLW
jgi:quinol-cytochrome oxidoreductase complex cytochrome b subunit